MCGEVVCERPSGIETAVYVCMCVCVCVGVCTGGMVQLSVFVWAGRRGLVRSGQGWYGCA